VRLLCIDWGAAMEVEVKARMRAAMVGVKRMVTGWKGIRK
jgi:hypothetical protein